MTLFRGGAGLMRIIDKLHLIFNTISQFNYTSVAATHAENYFLEE